MPFKWPNFKLYWRGCPVLRPEPEELLSRNIRLVHFRNLKVRREIKISTICRAWWNSVSLILVFITICFLFLKIYLSALLHASWLKSTQTNQRDKKDNTTFMRIKMYNNSYEIPKFLSLDNNTSFLWHSCKRKKKHSYEWLAQDHDG